jgi:SAM-dependent methyltransferase
VYASRNFYGTLRIKERRYSGADAPVRRLVHGVILHGLQDMNPDRRRSATTYYGPSSGVGLAILEKARKSPTIRVGVIGLGVGTLAVYGRSGDYYRMYEINPEVISVAQNEFTYVKDSAANVSFALGDARLVLEREKNNQFDVLVIDAFSSDSIPIHLMTREALAVYASHLKPDGVIAFHVTNRYLNLAPVVQAIALESGYDLALVSDEPTGDTHGLMALSDWVLVTKDRTFLAARSIVAQQLQIERIENLKPWSDDFNNLFQVLK